jgi:hypothetical protein
LRLFAGWGFGLLGEKHGLDIGEDATLRNGHARQQLVELLVVAYGQLKVPRNDASLLVVPSSIACQLEDLSSEIFEDSCEVDWSTSTHSIGIVSFAEHTVDTADGELQSGSA